MEKEVKTPEEKVFDLVMSSSESGVFAWSIVDRPANEIPSFFFSEEEVKDVPFHFSSDDERIMHGVLLVPEKKIARRNPDGTVRYVKFTKEEIKKIWKDCISKGNQNNIRFDHDGNDVKGSHTYEFRLSQENDPFHSMYNPNDLPDGSLVVSTYTSDEDVWKRTKSKKNFGLSIEGKFAEKEVMMEKEVDHDAKDILIDSIFKSDKSDDEKLKALKEILG